MPHIQKLPESVRNKIAAGEVIEGPFSVIKELVENSIDAGATSIDIEIIDGGFKKIYIKDNGNGIFKDDLLLAVENHATSKISSFEEIDRILSYGFRGEALASVSAISDLTILSRSVDEATGGKLISANGQIKISDYAGETGTTIIVENLFYNVPARKKFMKTEGAELRKIREILLKIALANCKISFSLSSNNKRIVTLVKSETIENRIEQIYGKSILDSLYKETIKDKVEISGFLSKPDFMKSTRSMQILYVNNRLIEYKNLGFLLSKSYEGIAIRGTYPAAFIFINIDPQLIDINIHPAKRELKFFDQSYINNLLLQFGSKVLGKIHELNFSRIQERKSFPDFSAGKSDEQLSFEKNKQFTEDRVPVNSSGNSFQENIKTGSFIREAGKLYNAVIDEKPENDFRFLEVIFDTYIITEKEGKLYFIDFHAAHERDIYNSINTDIEHETQTLIFPEEIDLSIDDYQLILEYKEYFNKIGFDLDIFSENSIIIRGIPVIASELNITNFISDIIEALKENKDHINDLNLIMAEKLACHSAKRSGDYLSKEDAKMIAERALSGDYEKRCPHGRPFIFTLNKTDLEKVFKRL